MDWDDLRFVVAVADMGSAVAAAQSLGVNPTTVQRRIARFEQINNVHLFVRRQSGYQPTPECEALVEASRPIEESVSAIKREILTRDTRLEGRLVMTTVDSLMDNYLAGYLAQFQELHPNIKIDVTLTNSHLDLSRQDADVAIRPSNNPPEHLVGQNVATLAIAIYGPAGGETVKVSHYLDVLSKHPNWIGAANTLGGSPIGAWINRNVPASSLTMSIDTFKGIATAIEAGCGIGMVPCVIGDNLPGLTRLSDPIDEVAASVWLLTHKEIKSSAKIRAFMQFMAKAIRADAKRFAGHPVV